VKRKTDATRRESRLRAAAEAQLSQNPSTVYSPAGAPAEEVLQELRVHEIELEMQNEELRRAQVALEESHHRYVDLYEFAPVGYLTLNHQALIAGANLTATGLLGEDRKKLLQRRFASSVAPEDRDRWGQCFAAMMRQDEPQSCELTLQRPDRTRFHARLHCRRVATEGDASSLRIALSDVTELKRTEEELRIAAIAFESSQEGMVVTDSKGVIVQVNQAFTRLTGYSASEAVGQKPALLRSGRQDKAFYERLWATLNETKYWQGEIWNRRKNGKTYAAWLTISTVIDPEGHITHYVASCSDITEKKAAEAEIHRLAYYDPLTELPNRRLLQDRLGQALAASARNGKNGAILFFDLDNFKALNDTRGHDVGDILLVEAAQRLQAGVRKSDTVARLGGDEFVVMLEGLSSDSEEAAVQATQGAEKIRKSLTQPYDLKGNEFHCTASVGVALFRGREAVKELLKQADLALYQAKNGGRDTLRFFDPSMQAAIVRRSTLVAELREALKRRQLRPYYQPQIDGAGRIIGAETLLRWMHAERGLMLPGEFISLAEETGLIVPIDQWVLATVCLQLQAWQASALTRGLKLAVNVSARQFRQPDFVEHVQQVLKKTGADPARLEIELIESLVMEDIAGTLEKMRALKALGIGFSMDGFGTGYASLSYLTRLPFDQIKIDQSFVRNLHHNAYDQAMVQTIMTMAKSLGLSVLAQGTETEAQREFLGRHDCDAFQGHLFSRPLPLDEFERYVDLHRER
jgi:diguanylate cyclase (GGDEF)-like protein/PAS domain S-box-containing protein